MQVLKRGHTQLFRRGPDECFDSIPALARYCQEQKEKSTDRWLPPRSLNPKAVTADVLDMVLGDDGAFHMNDWSFTQLCQLAKVSKDTVNRVTADTAWRVFHETMPEGNKPLQILTQGQSIRSIHGVSYTRLYNSDLLAMLQEFATDFGPPQKAAFGGNTDSGGSGGTGLYAGEQDMFAFLIDPTGWAEIDGQAFAPGFFIWNSEVGKRSLGIETFWFQAVCQNHIVWDATEVIEFSRKHTASIHDSLAEMRQIVGAEVPLTRAAKVELLRRMYSLAHWIELIRLIGYQAVPMDKARQAIKPLAEQYGKEPMATACEVLVEIFTQDKEAFARLNRRIEHAIEPVGRCDRRTRRRQGTALARCVQPTWASSLRRTIHISRRQSIGFFGTRSRIHKSYEDISCLKKGRHF